MERFGLRSSVPIPQNNNINVEQALFPEWPCTASPAPLTKTEEEWEGCRVSYIVKLHTLDDFHAELHTERERIKADTKLSKKEKKSRLDVLDIIYVAEKKEQERIDSIGRRKTVAIRFQEIRVPLIRLLRPRVAEMSRLKCYYSDYVEYDEEDLF